ncbi:MAG: DUF5316 domain-containing protein [Syntrophomonadaceae bacterium]
MKQMGIGLLIFCIFGFVGLIANDTKLIVNLAGGASIVLIALAVIFSGSLGSGDRIRANYTHEDRGERQRKNQWTSSLLLIALPNVVGAILLFAYLN